MFGDVRASGRLVLHQVAGVEIAGVVMWGRDPDDPAIGHVARLYVNPDRWGGGIGRALHDHALGQLADDGTSTAALWVLDGSDRARAWHEQLG
jgi:GNAT superfamily N-acetyltransferase